MAQLSTWWGAGVLTAGVSAALLTGAGAATADTGTDTSTTSKTTASTSTTSTRTSPKRSGAIDASDPDRDQDTVQSRRTPRTEHEKPARATTSEAGGRRPKTTRPERRSPRASETDPAQDDQPAAGTDDTTAQVETPTVIEAVLGPFQPEYPPLVRALGSAVFNVLGTVVQAADGPPGVPADLGDSVRVGSSGLVVAPGEELAADWYFPTTGDHQPQRLIYLQHGILATAPMYSHTAAYLAERTNSVVVATTITSNPFADGGMWLGGDPMHRAVAQVFLDEDRTALTASLSAAALKVGAPTLTVPKDIVIVGHSLGGGFAPGVAGHYAAALAARRADGRSDEDTANHLAGVVLLDAVPFVPILPNAMHRLATLENSNAGDPADYIPVYEIGAPQNFLNAFSAVNDQLSDARPGRFNGVVITGGVHMDGMLGGNPLIQAAAYLVAGIPQRQNPSAVQLLMAGWINDMFRGGIDPGTGRCLATDCEGSYGEPGATIVLPSQHGSATAVAIGAAAVPVLRVMQSAV